MALFTRINHEKENKQRPSNSDYLEDFPRAILCILVLLTGLAVSFSSRIGLGDYPVQDNETNKFSSENEASELRGTGIDKSLPRIAWLMTFPNSGTSFTLKMVGRVTLTTIASTYGREVADSDGNSNPVYPNEQNGPFWKDLESMRAEYSHPATFVLTKTHCGGRCEQCGPSVYTETPESFLKACCSGRRIYNGTVEKNMRTYNSTLVKSAVHLIRNPFNNIVSRFHLARKKKRHTNGEGEEVYLYPATREGFRDFCIAMNNRFAQEERDSPFVDSEVLEIMKNVPCHADFFRYAQWHNLAFKTTEYLDIPTHVLHYEDYGTDYESTVDGLLEFLQLERRGTLMEFINGKEYTDYFDPEEREAVKTGLEKLASSMTWRSIERYLDVI